MLISIIARNVVSDLSSRGRCLKIYQIYPLRMLNLPLLAFSLLFTPVTRSDVVKLGKSVYIFTKFHVMRVSLPR